MAADEKDDYSSDVLEIKGLLINLKEVLEILERTMLSRCQGIAKLTLYSTKLNDLTDINDKLNQEFDKLKYDVMTARENIKFFLLDFEKRDLTVPTVPDNNERQSMASVFRTSVIDGRGLYSQLKAMMLIASNYEKKNERLKELNAMLVKDILELLQMNLGAKIDNIETFVVPTQSQTSNQISFTDEDSIDVLKIELIGLKASLNHTDEHFLPQKSVSSNEISRLSDSSLPENEMEILELTPEQWSYRLHALKEKSDRMTLTDTKLVNLRVLFKRITQH